MARYFQSQPQQFVSQFVPENLELKQGYYEGLQANQDKLNANIGALQKDINSTEYDKPEAFSFAKQVNSQLGELSGLNANDPTQKQKIFEGIKNARYAMSPYGQGNAYETRYKQDAEINKAIDEDKEAVGENAWMKKYYKDEFKYLNNAESNPVNYNPKTGQFNQIIPPTKLKPVEAKKEIHAVLEDISKDKSYASLGYGNTPVDFTVSYKEGNTGGYAYQKVAQTLLNRIGDVDNIRTYQAKSRTLLGTKEDGSPVTDERKFAIFDKKGNFVKFNTNTLLGQELEGALIGKVSKEDDFNTKFIDDKLGLHNAKRTADEEAVKNGFSTTFGPGDTTYDGTKFAGIEIKDLYVKNKTTGEDELDLSKLTEGMNSVTLDDFKTGIFKGMVEPNFMVGLTNGMWQNKANKLALMKQAFANADLVARANGIEPNKAIEDKNARSKDYLDRTLKFMQNLSVSNNAIAYPDDRIAQNVDTKIKQGQFRNDLMVDSEGKTFASDLEDAGDKSTSKFAGWDLSDKENPKMRMELKTEDGKPVYKSYSIPNDTYKNYLKKSAEFVGDVRERTTDIKKRDPNEILVASKALTFITNPNDRKAVLNGLDVKDYASLTPIMTREFGGEVVSVYMKKDSKGNPTGEQVSIGYVPKRDADGLMIGLDKVTSISSSVTDLIQDNIDDMTSNPEFRDIAPKEKKVEYSDEFYNENQ